MKSTRLLTILTEDLVWEGFRPHVKPTTTRRKADPAAFHGVTSGVYYVAGKKIGNMYKEVFAWPIKDRGVNKCCCQLPITSYVKGNMMQTTGGPML